MNLLVTNTRNPQSYAIIRALRPHCEKLVVTMYGKNRLEARFSHAANSRLVDKRYYVPSPVEDWRAGRIQQENTEREEAYIQAVEKICEREKIDTIFPSFDPQVYVFSKNKERFEAIGIVVPVPDYEAVTIPLDKYRTIQAAQAAGFPCPTTYLPDSEDDVKRIAMELGFPLVVKPRFTAGGRGTAMAKDLRELLSNVRAIVNSQSMPIIQEFIEGPSAQKLSLQIVTDRNGKLKSAVCFLQLRHLLKTLSATTASESVPQHPYILHAVELLRQLGWWGGASVETKMDPRDDIPKLMEINPRLGLTLWQRTALGINVPLMCLKIAKCEEVEATDYPVGTVFVEPIEDMMGLVLKCLDRSIYRVRVMAKGRSAIGSPNPSMPFKEIIRSYKGTYFSRKKKLFSPYFTCFFRDPLVSILWWSQYSTLVLRAIRQLGR